MDDLYDNLENYHDENIIDELKNENEELKTKLEEYSTAMIRLQNDFDKLNSEYKNLERNYSSLLKTARAEIERKSEMIKTLNSEKDILIIKSLQTSGRNILKNRKHNIANDAQRSKKSHEVHNECSGKLQAEPNLHISNQENSHRNNSSRLQSEETTSSQENNSNFTVDKELRKNNFSNKIENIMSNITKEIHKDVPMQCHKTKGEKIYDRRKSMPRSRIEPIFSSDDDFEALDLKNVRKSPLKEDIRHSEKYSKRDNSYNSIKDDKFYSNKSRYTDYDKYKHDRHESCSKYTRRSPGKYRSKNIKEYPETNKSRGDYKYSRRRVLQSPSTDKYNRSKSRDRKTFNRDHYYDKKRYSPQDYDNSAVKHKIRNELEEPSTKRQKTELIKKSNVEENIYNDRDKEIGFRNSLSQQQELIEPSSCQSPDYVNIDSMTPQHVTKEIKQTAITSLEDPRITSKKYVKRNNETILSTVGENVDIIPINVAMWDIQCKKKFSIFPTKTLPENFDKQFNRVDEIYMNIDNPLLEVSLGSRESQSISDCNDLNSKENDDDNKYETEKIDKNKAQNDKLNCLNVIDSNKTKNLDVKKYKIPKIKKPDKPSSGVKQDDFELLSKKRTSARNNENKEGEIQKQEVITLPKPIPVNIENVTNYVKQDGVDMHNEIIITNFKTLIPEVTAVVGTLADDLELSDEANENRDTQRDVKKSKKNSSKENITIDNNQHTESKIKVKPMSSKKGTKDLSQDSGKIRKSKKKIEQKEVNCTEIKEQNKELQEGPKHKDKQSKPILSIETKTKFSDLFGDSSSLITPDDLGIYTPDVQIPLTDKHASIFDNTQDAVDLHVKDVNKVKCNTSLSGDELSNNKTIIEKTSNVGENTLVSQDVAETSTANNLYENATINDATEIIKTVIISTGVQPKYTSDSITLQDSQKNGIENIDKINNDKVNMTTCVLNNIKALATSTPYKPEFQDVFTAKSDPKIGNSASKTEKSNVLPNVSNSSNPDDIINEVDAPDVRIFVRRRRRLLKKS